MNSSVNLISIFCHQKDFSLAWHINKQLSCSLEMKKNVKIKGYYFHRFFSHTKTNHYPIYLVSNKSTQNLIVSKNQKNSLFEKQAITLKNNKTIFPSQKRVDFFIITEGIYNKEDMNKIVSKIRKIPFVLATKIINLEMLKFKSRINLIKEI